MSGKSLDILRTFENQKYISNDEVILSKQGYLIYSIGATSQEIQEFDSQPFILVMPGEWIRNYLWGEIAWAFEPKTCPGGRSLGADLDHQVQEVAQCSNRLALADFVKKCDFNIEELLSQKVQELKSALAAVQNANLEDFFGAVKSSFRAIVEILPQINSKIILPLQELAEKVPPLANKLVCDFVENKVGDLILAGVAGPAGIGRAMMKSTFDIGEFAQLIYKYTKNGTASFFVHDLHLRGLLKPKYIDRLTKLEADISSDVKRNIGNRFSGFRDREKMREHIDKHKAEMGFKSDEEYLQAARNFAKRTGADNLAFLDGDAVWKKWNTKTNEIVIVTTDGQLITYYRQNCHNISDKLLVLISTKKDQQNEPICREYSKR